MSLLVHPDSAHLVVWPPRWRPGICAAIPIETNGAKLLGAPIGTEPFWTYFVARRASKATASVAALERSPPSATWTVLRFCINERVNYLAQVTEFPLIRTHGHNYQSSLAPRRRLTARAFRPPDAPHHAYPSLPTYGIGWVRHPMLQRISRGDRLLARPYRVL
jgi:hypothetical protein